MRNFFATLRSVFSQPNQNQSNVSSSSTQSESVSVPVTGSEVDTPGRLSDAVAPEGKEFDIHKGPIVATIAELATALREAPTETFTHHMHTDGNDFAQWVGDVFNDKPAADIINSAGNSSEVVYILEELS